MCSTASPRGAHDPRVHRRAGDAGRTSGVVRAVRISTRVHAHRGRCALPTLLVRAHAPRGARGSGSAADWHRPSDGDMRASPGSCASLRRAIQRAAKPTDDPFAARARDARVIATWCHRNHLAQRAAIVHAVRVDWGDMAPIVLRDALVLRWSPRLADAVELAASECAQAGHSIAWRHGFPCANCGREAQP